MTTVVPFPGSIYDQVNNRLDALENATTHTHTSSEITDFDSKVDERIENIIDSAPSTLDTLNELAAALGDDPNFSATTAGQIAAKASNADLAALALRVTALENWKSVMPKRSKRFTGTTDANGDVTIDLTSGAFTSAPSIGVTYIFNNNNYGTHYNIKALSATSVQLRVMRNKNTSVGALGGDVDPDEPLASTAIVLRATEF